MIVRIHRCGGLVYAFLIRGFRGRVLFRGWRRVGWLSGFGGVVVGVVVVMCVIFRVFALNSLITLLGCLLWDRLLILS